jgi:hypothetical protein
MTTTHRTPRLRRRPSAAGRTLLLASALAMGVTACADRLPSAPDALTKDSLAGLITENNGAIQRIASTVKSDTARGAGSTGTAGTAGSITGGDFSFPAALALTATQQNQIAALRAAYAQATAADSVAWKAIVDKALAARAAGSPASVIDEIVASGVAISERLSRAARKLEEDILAVLTPAQRDWLAKCAGPQALSVQQQQQLAALQTAFDQATAADVAAIQAALSKIEALRAGSGAGTQAVEEQIRAVIEAVLPARLRLSAAQQQLAQQVSAVTGPSGCAG